MLEVRGRKGLNMVIGDKANHIMGISRKNLFLQYYLFYFLQQYFVGLHELWDTLYTRGSLTFSESSCFVAFCSCHRCIMLNITR